MRFSLSERLLHNLITKNKLLGKFFFEFEKILFLKKTKKFQNNKHIFVSGLPRSGSSIFTIFLHNTGKFGSLTYSDSPFLLAPNFFSKFKKKDTIKNFQRIHGDGIEINLNSPEALDNLFFLTYGREFHLNIIDYIDLILFKTSKNRYLSKNNNIFNEFEKLFNLFPNMILVVPFRNPYQQSYSLLKQHLNMKSKQKKNKFILEYMNSMGHNEFGLGYKFRRHPDQFNDPENINHWIEQWCLYYDSVINKFKNKKNVFFLNYELVCEDKNYFEKICQILEVNFIDNKKNFTNKNSHEIPKNYNKIQSYAIELYNNLTQLSKRSLNI